MRKRRQKFQLDLNLPNTITLIRIGMIPLIMLFLLLPIPGKYLLSAILFIGASATDGLDGHIARSRNMVTTLGKFLDPLADKLLILSTLICLMANEKAGAVAIIIILTRELMVTGLRAIAADKGVVIAASYFGKVKTVSQIVAISYILIAGQFTALPAWLGTLFLWIAVVITILSGVDYFYKGRALFADTEAQDTVEEAEEDYDIDDDYSFESDYDTDYQRNTDFINAYRDDDDEN